MKTQNKEVYDDINITKKKTIINNNREDKRARPK